MQDSISPTPSSSEALPRSKVIRRRMIFDAARIKGRRITNRYMALNYLTRNPALQLGSAAFLTPKRLGDATKRTRLRRQMREIYRRHLAVPVEPAYLIWVARPTALELDFEGLKACMSELRQRLITELARRFLPAGRDEVG